MRQKAAKSQVTDFDWAFGLNRLTLNIMGVWSDEKVRTSRTKQAIIPCVLATIFIWFYLPVNLALTKVIGELSLVLDNSMYNNGALNSLVKLYFLWSSRKSFQPLIEIIQADWRNGIKTSWKHKIMVKQAQRALIFTISCCTVSFFCCLGFVFSPVFGLSIRIINNITDPYEGYNLPLPTYYPFDYGKSPIFELVYASQSVAGILCVFAETPDIFFAAVVFHACGQCEILQRRTKSFLDDYIIDIAKVDYEHFRTKLRKIVDSHVRLISFVNTVEDSFNMLILSETIILTSVTCCLGFNVVKSFANQTKSLSVIQILTLSGTVINFNFHMFIFCMASEILLEKSIGFSNLLYCSNWYLLPPKYRKEIIPIMIRSKQPLELTAGSFQNLSLNFYMRILKTSAGYFSVLLALSK